MDCFLIDDMIASGGPMVKAGLKLDEQGANSVNIGAIHPLFTKGFEEICSTRNKSGHPLIDQIIISDTVQVLDKVSEASKQFPNINNQVQIIETGKAISQSIQNTLESENAILIEASKSSISRY